MCRPVTLSWVKTKHFRDHFWAAVAAPRCHLCETSIRKIHTRVLTHHSQHVGSFRYHFSPEKIVVRHDLPLDFPPVGDYGPQGYLVARDSRSCNRKSESVGTNLETLTSVSAPGRATVDDHDDQEEYQQDAPRHVTL
jgi:hypothetical protein